jgi:hypothetical protein
MDKPLTSPLLIEQVGRPTKLSPSATFAHLQNFLVALDAGPSKTQLERLADALGVEVGAIEPSEGERREAERAAALAAARAERKLRKEEERAAAEAAQNKETEDALEAEADEDEMEMGENTFEGDQTMDDRGDIEYGDAVDDDNDEPDNDDE